MDELSFTGRIRECAYQLWQQDGSLEGCADEYWQIARTLVEREFGLPVPADPPDSDAVAPG
ncbi:DUF2934 domain-containing protein [Paraburkholderia fungorum]|uniref:DUF2934 domain-containing protein n=1 Tax=Paraburkholderia fungorum TaxID=134537 RepID=UPI0038BD4C4F